MIVLGITPILLSAMGDASHNDPRHLEQHIRPPLGGASFDVDRRTPPR